MPDLEAQVRVRPLDELDIGGITRIDERITGIYRPEVWESRVGYYLRRDPDSSQVAEVEGRLVGFMLGDVRAGEFGIEQPSGWIEPNSVEAWARMMASRCLASSSVSSEGRVRFFSPACSPTATVSGVPHSILAQRQKG